ncbi:prolyl oligopeptidase family serine peptidase [Kitasatospora cathayae]|uniref:Prolyl oligopeptidase family serine peptidase n=1 Tax=Kitasatospora cathayae TaxID=3004092 RepID=A0ABY7Q8B8_9ACTN|nr:prolyl oligopeptidase family serine peptidase [Kitasatospora sp. HUAS 3-15]WBP88551.1 prolyl oligopeptidase family serine peptidase [Kitasatospora sp. HUAS 3-15]
MTTSFPQQLARTRRFTLGLPVQPEPSADGATVLFLRSRGGTDPLTCLWALDADSGEERLIADPGVLGSDEGITAYSTDATGSLAVFALGGGLWLADASTASVRRVACGGEAEEVRLDPTGRTIAYVSGGALRVVGVDGTGDRALAEPEASDVTYGLAEYVAASEMYRDRGYWWSPDGRALLVARVDERAVTRIFLADPTDPRRPPRAIRYPLAGTANADVSLWLLGLDGSRPRTEVRWDRAGFEYLTAAGWDGHGPYAAVQSRDQRTVRTLAIEPDGGVRVLAERTDPHWVELLPGLPVRTESGALVDTADEGDTRQLTVGGKPVTPAGLQLRGVLGVEGEQVLFTASEEPTETHLWAYRPDLGPQKLSDGPGLHTGVRRGGTLVLTSRVEGARSTVLRDGRPTLTLTSYAELPVVAARPELLRLGPRELRASLFLPTGRRAGDGPLPVLLDPYAGPAMQKVTTDGAWHEQVSQWFADQGFAVLVVDGRGTPGRGPLWDKTIWGDKAGPALEDQIEGLREAARLRPGLFDLDRVAIRGWSYGGFLAALAVLRRPDVFHAASAGAAPTDHRLYDTHWQERFLGHPDEYPEHYDSCDLVVEAPKLRRPLLLVQGLADDNVFPAHTLRLSHALLAAGRPHEVLPLRGAGHRPTDEAVVENLLWHELGFLRRSLGLE